MRILVTTPTGTIGRRVVRELLAPEFSVRVLAREPARLAPEVRDQAEIICGSTDEPEPLRRALDGIEAVLWSVPTEPWRVPNLRAHYERHAQAGCRALQEAGTPRVVTISAAISGLLPDAGRLSALRAMEDILAESGAAIRHLRCSLFMENFLSQANSIHQRGTFSYPLPGDLPVPMVAASDVADSALRWLVQRNWTGVEGVAVRGPEDLSFCEAAAIIEQALQRPVVYREASANEHMQNLVGLGASAAYARGQVNMFAALARGTYHCEPGTRESTTPTTLATWTQNELAPRFRVQRAPEEVKAAIVA